MNILGRLSIALIASAAVSIAHADTIKVGVIGTMSGPFALYGQNFKWGIDAWVAKHGDKIGNNKVEFIYRDEDEPDPAKSKALAQELIVKDKVQYLAGMYFTPDAMAVAPLLERGKVPLVVMNAATSSIVQKSPYIVRTSFTMWQNTVPAAETAHTMGLKKAAVLVSDYGPGHDADEAFKTTFEKLGGKVVEDIKMPLSTTDFGPIMQKVKDSGADAIFAFLPSGPATLSFVKAYIDNGLKAAGVKMISLGDVMTEPDLPSLGDAGLGILSTYHYAVSHDSPENKAFIKALENAGAKPDKITMTSVAAYDGARLIYKMIEATDGKQEPAKAIKAVEGMKWTSPRGPVSIDPKTRNITQNIYLRKVEKVDGQYINKEIKTFKAQPDWGLEKK